MRLLAVTCDRRTLGPKPQSPRVRPARPEVYLTSAVVDAVRAAGAEPLLVPPAGPQTDVAAYAEALLSRCDGVVITGGPFDIHPRHYGRVASGRLDRVDEGRTGLELTLAAACLAQQVPVLGLCGGEQALAVAAGGTLVGDLRQDWPGAAEHEQPTDPAKAWHAVHTEPGILQRVYGLRLEVNSTHHQAVEDPGLLRVTGRAPDGVVEAVELDGHPFCLGVQWHPELLDAALFEALVAAC
jgi:putative glutamine amidotransferase